MFLKIFFYFYFYFCLLLFLFCFVFVWFEGFQFLYRHRQHHNYTMIKTDAMIKTQEDIFKQNIYLSLYCKGSKGVTQSLRVRGNLGPNRNFNILSPTLMSVNVVSFSFSRCSTGGSGVHSAGYWLSLLHLISNFSGPQTPSVFPRAPSGGCGFPYHISSYSFSNSTATGTRTLSWVIW